MRKKLIDSTKADIKKYMMIVESAGKVPASIREDFQLEDIENPYFQGDEDTEESEGNRYYVTVGVKIGYDENTDSYFPEVIWDQETGTEIEFDKLDKISKKSIQDKCDEIGPKIHVQRKGVNEASESWVITDKKTGKYVSRSALSKPLSPFVDDVKTAKTFDAYFDALSVIDELKAKNPKLSLIAQKNQISEEYESIPSANKIKLGDYTEVLDPELSDFKIGMVIHIDADSYGKFHNKVGIIQTNGMNMTSRYTKTKYKQFKAKMPGGDVIDVRSDDVTLYKPKNQISESTQIIVKALMQKFKISESRAKSIVAKVSESLIFETNDSEEHNVDVFVKHPVTRKSIEVSVSFIPTANGGYKIVEVSDVMTGVIYKLQSFDSSSVNKINTEIQTVLDDSVSETTNQ